MFKTIRWIFASGALLFALNAAAAPTANGLVAAGRGTPVIDGKLDDAAWQHSIAATPFLLRALNSFAKEQTAVRFLWDDENLYIAFRCQTRVLDPVNNQLHAFQDQYQGRDTDRIFKDDCVLLLLVNPATPDRIYDFAVSAGGAISDYTSERRDPWGTRNPEWNASATVKTFRNQQSNNSFWSAEIAIPWRSLTGGSAPNPNAAWEFLAARFEQDQKEVSAFQPVKIGIHRPDNFGRLKFVKKSLPGLELTRIPAFTPGANRLEVALVDPVGIELATTVKFENQPPRRFRTKVARQATRANVDFVLQQGGEFGFSWKAASSAALTDYFVSPDYRIKVSALTLQSELRGATLKVNGEPVKSGVMLVSGLNTLELDNPTAAGVALRAGEQEIEFPGVWRKNGSRSTLKLLVEDSLVWPNWHAAGAITLAQDSIMQLLFAPRGVSGLELNDYTILLDLPDGVSLLGASGYYKKHPLEIQSRGDVTLAGRRYTRYAIRLNTLVNYQKNVPKHQHIALFLKSAADAPTGESVLYYHIESASAGVAEVPNRLKVRMLPRFAGKRPERLLVQLWPGWLHALDNRALVGKLNDFFARCGITESSARSERANDPVRGFVLIGFQSWNLSLQEYLDKHPGTERQGGFGSRYPLQVCCSTEMVRNPDFAAYLKEKMPAWFEYFKNPAHVDWDYESGIYNSYLSCSCPRCMEDFATFAKLDAKSLTPEIIKQRHEALWTDYNNRRVADVAGLLRDAVHSYRPNVIFSVYSGYQSETTHKNYGINWKYFDGKIDLAMIGYGRTRRELEASRAALPNTPILLGAIIYPYNETERYAPQMFTQAQLLRRAADATAGILLYEYPIMDARSFQSLAAVTTLLADYEDFFSKGLRVNDKLHARWLDESNYAVLSDGRGGLLVLLMNFDSVARSYEFTLDTAAGQKLRDAQTHAEVPAGPVRGKLAPFGIAAFIAR